MNSKIQQLEKKIKIIKEDLNKIENMMPGTLHQQSRISRTGETYGKYWSLSYRHNNKSQSGYIREELVNEVEIQLRNYKEFKKLVDQWRDLSIQLSLEKLKIARKNLEEKG